MFIEKIIIINLLRCEGRKNKLLESLERVGIKNDKVIFLPAFDSNILPNYFDRKFYSQKMNRTFAKGELCCTLSHISAIKMAKALNYENILILEDDIELCDDFIDRINCLAKQLPKNWGQIYIGAIIDNIGTKISDNLYEVKTNQIMGTHSYLLHKSVYDIVSDKLFEFNSATDGEFEIMHKDGVINAYVYLPLMTYQYDGYSEITHTNKQMENMTNKYFKQ